MDVTDDDAITFPDAPRGELDRALTDLVGRAREVMKTQGRLRALVRANQAVVSHLDLPTVLRTIVDAAVDLVDAKYGALGVVAQQGGLEQFIHVGMTPRQVEGIGHLPEGHGLLGALIDDPRPVRLDRIADDARSVGFPDGHPAMDSFLGVPIRVRDLVYGNLYLTNHLDGAFTPDDEQLVNALAATAGFAIDNARLFAETEARQSWGAATAAIAATLLSGEPDDALVELVEHVEQLSRSDLVCVLIPDDQLATITITVARGSRASEISGNEQALLNDHLRNAIESSQPVRVDSFDDQGVQVETWHSGPALIVPLRAGDETTAVLVAIRSSDAVPFTAFELERAADIAAQAAIAMELAAARADRQRIQLLEDRSRIARDLHDHVIQQLFAVGLEIQSIKAAAIPGITAKRLDATVGFLEDAIGQIRTIIFALSRRRESTVSVRHQLIDLADELSPALVRPATLAFSGPVDLVVTGDLIDDIVAFVREGLTNIARHAQATSAAVDIDATSASLTITIQDDGVGLGESTRRSGLRNGEERAQRHGGHLSIESSAQGTRLIWTVPIAEREQE